MNNFNQKNKMSPPNGNNNTVPTILLYFQDDDTGSQNYNIKKEDCNFFGLIYDKINGKDENEKLKDALKVFNQNRDTQQFMVPPKPTNKQIVNINGPKILFITCFEIVQMIKSNPSLQQNKIYFCDQLYNLLCNNLANYHNAMHKSKKYIPQMDLFYYICGLFHFATYLRCRIVEQSLKIFFSFALEKIPVEKISEFFCLKQPTMIPGTKIEEEDPSSLSLPTYTKVRLLKKMGPIFYGVENTNLSQRPGENNNSFIHQRSAP